jgi:hypothetical protein
VVLRLRIPGAPQGCREDEFHFQDADAILTFHAAEAHR